MSLNPAEMTWDVALSVAVPVLAAVASLSVERVRAASKKSARGREYWNDRLDERIAQAEKVDDQRFKERTIIALDNLEAEEALERMGRPSPLVSWILAGAGYLAGVVAATQELTLWALVGYAAGALAQVDGHVTIERRNSLRQALVDFVSLGPGERELLKRHPHEVRRAWKRTSKARRKLSTSTQTARLLSAATRKLLGEDGVRLLATADSETKDAG